MCCFGGVSQSSAFNATSNAAKRPPGPFGIVKFLSGFRKAKCWPWHGQEVYEMLKTAFLLLRTRSTDDNFAYDSTFPSLANNIS